MSSGLPFKLEVKLGVETVGGGGTPMSSFNSYCAATN